MTQHNGFSEAGKSGEFNLASISHLTDFAMIKANFYLILHAVCWCGRQTAMLEVVSCTYWSFCDGDLVRFKYNLRFQQ